MIKDIVVPEVKNVKLAVGRKKSIDEHDIWRVYLINNNNFSIENTIIASKGYGEKSGEKQQTSILRHFFETVEAHTAVLIEPINPEVFICIMNTG